MHGCGVLKPNHFKKHHFYLLVVNIPDNFGHGVLCMHWRNGTSLRPIEKCCFLKYFGFSFPWELSILACSNALQSTAHTGIFAKNSFQIDSINSYSTSKEPLFWLKIVKIIHFLTLKPIKGILCFILKMLKKIARWPTSQKSQKEM